MKRHVMMTAMIAVAASGLAACSGIVPFPGVHPHTLDRDDSASSSSSSSAASSRMSVVNRRACHEKQQKDCG